MNVPERVELPDKTTQLLNLNKGGEVWPHGDITSCKHFWIRRREFSKTIHAYQHQVDRHYGYLLSKAYGCLTSKIPAQLVHKFKRWVIGMP